MKKVVTTKEKQGFIRWFLNHKQLQRREGVWILNYIMDHENVLKNVHFVTSAARLELLEEKQRLVQMSCHDVDLPAFKYFKETMSTTDAEKTFHDIRLNTDSPIFINLHYKGVESCDNYFMIEEDAEIPYIILGISHQRPKKKASKLEELQNGYVEIHPKREPVINSLLDNVTHSLQVEKLKRSIDLALQDNNKELFLKLSTELNSLTQPEKLFETVK